MAKKSRKEKQRSSRQKNLIRGLIGDARNQRHPKPAVYKEKILRNGFLHSRSYVDPRNYDEYIGWLNKQAILLGTPSIKSVADINSPSLCLSLEPQSLENEIRWAVSVIKTSIKKINRYLKHKQLVESHLIHGDENGFFDELSKIETLFGKSLWHSSIKISGTQYFCGLEEHKKVSEGLRSYYGHSINSFIVYNTSVRNEPNANIESFLSEFDTWLEKTKITKETKNYLKYKIGLKTPTEKSELSDILRIDQSNSTIDSYETFIKVAQSIVENSNLIDMRSFISRYLGDLSPIDDYRIEKMRFLATGQLRSLSDSSNSIRSQDLALTGYGYKALRSNLKETNTNSPTVKDIIIRGLLIQKPKNDLGENKKKLLHYLSRKVSEIISGQSGYEESFSKLYKICKNFNGLSLFSGLSDIIECKSEVGFCKNPLKKISLRSPYKEPEDIFHDKERTPPELLSSVSERFYASCIYNHENKEVVPSIVSLAQASICERLDDYFNCSKTTEIILRTEEVLSIRQAALALYQRCIVDDTLTEKSLNIITNEVIINRTSARNINFARLSNGKKWRSFKHLSSRIDLSIFFHLAYKDFGDDLTFTNLRFAFDDFMKSVSAKKPSQIDFSRIDTPIEKLIYFLKNVCVHPVMDISRSFQNPREIDEERVEICKALKNLDSRNSDIYDDEILSIVKKFQIKDGLKIVDNSRIHVDKDSLLQWAAKALKERHARYKDLVEAGIGVSDNLDTIIDYMLNKQHTEKHYFEMPENEADKALIEIHNLFRDQFLFNSVFGLDSYLSKRIRHGSISGYLRNPVETQNLITRKNSQDGKYKPNNYWLEKLSSISEEEQEQVTRAFSKFSENYDRLINLTKNDVLHILTKDKPAGVFSIDLTTSSLLLFRGVVQSDLEFKNFLISIYQFLWMQLEPSLSRSRSFIEDNLADQIAGLFYQLSAELSPILSGTSVHSEFSSSIRSAAEGVQAEILNISKWFSREGQDISVKYYDFEQIVDISIESVLSTYRNFHPDISLKTSVDAYFEATSLSIITDVLFIAIGNVVDRSGLSSPKIYIHITYRESDESLNFRVESEIAKGIQNSEAQERLAVISSKIENRDYSVLRREGGSGLIKLASLVYQSPKGNLDFGFISDDSFYLDFDLSIVMKKDYLDKDSIKESRVEAAFG